MSTIFLCLGILVEEMRERWKRKVEGEGRGRGGKYKGTGREGRWVEEMVGRWKVKGGEEVGNTKEVEGKGVGWRK